jgi:hypothetical protein
LTNLTWNGRRLPSFPILSIISQIRDCLINLLIAIVLQCKTTAFRVEDKGQKKAAHEWTAYFYSVLRNIVMFRVAEALSTLLIDHKTQDVLSHSCF